VQLKFDLQLYKVDDGSYLVDFKLVGAVSAHPGKSHSHSLLSPSDHSGLSPVLGTAANLKDIEDREKGSKVLLFLNACSKMITELAISS
jgi:hypothetical protein